MLATIGVSLAIFNNNKNTELLIKNKANKKQQKTQEENLKLSNQAQKNVLKAQLKTFQIKLNKLKKEFNDKLKQQKTALAEKLSKSELLNEIKTLLKTQNSLKSATAIALHREFDGYFNKGEIKAKLNKFATKTDLASKLDTNQLLAEINKLDFENPTLKNKLIKALKTNLKSLTKSDLTVEKSNKKSIENKLSKSELLNEIKSLLKTEDSLKSALITALETKFATLASKTALASKLDTNQLLDEIKHLLKTQISLKNAIGIALYRQFSRYFPKNEIETKLQKLATKEQLKSKLDTNQLLDEIKHLLKTQISLKNAIGIALYRQFSRYFPKNEIETKLQKLATKEQLKSKLDTNQLLDEINKLDFNQNLKDKLTTALETKFDTLATKEQLKSKLDTNQLLDEIRFLLDRTSLGNLITVAINRSFTRYYRKEELTKLKELERFLIKTDQTTPESVQTVINQIVRTKLIEHIFTKWIQKFQSLSNIDSTNDLSNTDGSKNSFYKLAPFLFKGPNQANQKLNELLTGSLTKRNKWAIWATKNGFWKIGKLSELIKENDRKYQKVVFQNNKWVVKTNLN